MYDKLQFILLLFILQKGFQRLYWLVNPARPLFKYFGHHVAAMGKRQLQVLEIPTRLSITQREIHQRALQALRQEEKIHWLRNGLIVVQPKFFFGRVEVGSINSCDTIGQNAPSIICTFAFMFEVTLSSSVHHSLGHIRASRRMKK